MARPRKETIVEDNELFSIEAEELDEVLKGLPSDDAVINLFRVNPIGRSAYVAEFSPGEFSLDAVKNTYGGGKYKYVAKSNGVVRKGTVEIDGEPMKDGKPITRQVYKRYINGKLVFSKPEDAEVVVGPQVTERSQGDIGLTLLLDEIRRLREEMKQPQQSPETIKKSFLEEMMIFKQLFGNDKSPSEDLSKNVIELIKQGIEVGQMAENGGSPWMMILDKVLPTVQDALKAIATQQQRAITRPLMPIPGSIEAIAPKPEIPLTGFESIADKLRAYLPTFLSAASANSDPNILTDLTYPQIPEREKETVKAWLASDKWFSDLSTLHPLIQGQQAWWQEYRDGLLLSLQSPEGAEIDHDET